MSQLFSGNGGYGLVPVAVPSGRRIVSIASAPGWGALFEDDQEVGGQRLVTLAAWALVERIDGDSQVVGLVQRTQGEQRAGRVLGFADEVNGFIGYTNQGLKTKPAE